mgnify:CR=1 FL=1
MKNRRRITQISLIFIGIFLILATYFYYPKFIKNKISDEDFVKEEIIETKEKKSNLFENVEYQGIYHIDKSFTVKSENAYILEKDSDMVYMNKMHVTLYLSDGRNVVITSDRGKYNKVSYDCFFIDNVKASDNETIVFSENLDLLASNETASVYNNVVITNPNGSLKADKVDYNFETKYYKISMFNNEKVKIKLLK